MKKLICFFLFLSLQACTTCYRYMDAYNSETKETRKVCMEEGPSEFTLFMLSAASLGSGLAATQRDIVSNPHYQAGGSAYRDYTQPVNRMQ